MSNRRISLYLNDRLRSVEEPPAMTALDLLRRSPRAADAGTNVLNSG